MAASRSLLMSLRKSPTVLASHLSTRLTKCFHEAQPFPRPYCGLIVMLLFFAPVLVFLIYSEAVAGRVHQPGEIATSTSAAAESIRAIEPIVLDPSLDPQKIRLGKRLFHDSRLSADNTVSCASCHALTQGGADSSQRSRGVEGREGSINAPTVLNAALHFRQFWDGRAATLEDQIEGPIHNPLEMATNWTTVVTRLKADPEYQMAFRESYPAGIQPETVRDAIATFEKALLTPNSRFDQFLRGNREALTAEEKEGYRLFQECGCISCHQGAAVGGNMYGTMGVMADYFADRGNITPADWGRFNVTGRERDRYRFKVPSLRNVELTAPYFHDGSAATLTEAVNTMARYQLGRLLRPSQTEAIVAFLRTLSAPLPPEVE